MRRDVIFNEEELGFISERKDKGMPDLEENVLAGIPIYIPTYNPVLEPDQTDQIMVDVTEELVTVIDSIIVINLIIVIDLINDATDQFNSDEFNSDAESMDTGGGTDYLNIDAESMDTRDETDPLNADLLDLDLFMY